MPGYKRVSFIVMLISLINNLNVIFFLIDMMNDYIFPDPDACAGKQCGEICKREGNIPGVCDYGICSSPGDLGDLYCGKISHSIWKRLLQ